jgi:hypothetical protein
MDISGYTSAQIREIPELAHLYKVVLFMEKNKGKILFPEKYQASMIDRAQEKTIKFFNEHPEMQLKDAVVAILGSFTTDVPGFALLKMTEEIIKTHEKLSTNVLHEARELETA